MATWTLRDQYNRALNTIFAPGNAGITTHLLDGTGADIGSQFASGNSGIATKLENAAGTDIGSLFALISGGSPFAASISPNPLNEPLKAAGSYTDTMTCNASGGTGPYTYAWSITGLGATLSNTTLATVTINYTVPSHGGALFSSTLTCATHDSASHSASPTATFTYKGPP
jgi:hypothetical protein